MNLGREQEMQALIYELEKLIDPISEGGEATTNRAMFLAERLINVTRFASQDEEISTALEARGFINNVSLVGESKLLFVRVAVLSGKDPKDQAKNRYQYYDCRVFKPHLVKWFSVQGGESSNKLEGLLVKVKIRNPFCITEQGYLNCSGILEAIEI